MGGEGSTRKRWGMECKQKKKKRKPHTSQNLFLLQKCKFIYIYIFRSWNVVVTY